MLDDVFDNALLTGLETENRVGVMHFKPGQMRAWRLSSEQGEPELRVVRFVSGMGHAWIVCLEQDDVTWRGMMAVEVRPSGLSHGWQGVPAAFRVTPAMASLLENPESLEPA